MFKKGLLLSLTAACISGFSIFINKFGTEVISPSVFSWLKNTVVALMLLASFWFLKDFRLLKQLNGKQWFKLLFIGLVGGAVAFLLYFEGLALTSAAQASFWHKTLFVWSTILAVIFLKEKINHNYLIAGLLILLGNLLVLKLLVVEFNQGDILVMLATFCWSVEIIVSKKILSDLPVRIVVWARMFFGSLAMSLWLILTGQISLATTINLTQWSWVLLNAFLLLGYLAAWYSSLKLLPVSLAGAILSLGGIVTALLNFFILNQPLSQFQFLGVMILSSGLLLVLVNQFFKKPSILEKNEI